MKIILSTFGFAIVLCASAFAEANSVWSCNAKSFYTGEEVAEGAFARIPVSMKTGSIEIEVLKGVEGKFIANFQTFGDTKQKIENAPIATSYKSPANVDLRTFKKALSYVAAMTEVQDVVDATSYSTFQVIRKNGEVYFLGMDILKDQKVIARALMFPNGQIVAKCE